jgi:hypothetical protein
MIESLEIENFRCFEKLSVSDLSWVNVVVGESAAGKTALLEAVCIGMGAAMDIPMKFRAWRGLTPSMTFPMTSDSYEALWEDLFFQFDQKRTIRVALHGTAETTRSLELSYRPQTAATVPVPTAESPAAPPGPRDSSVITPITFEWTYAGGQTFQVQPLPTAPGVLTAGKPQFPALSAFYSASFMAVTSPSEAANQFSAFSRKRKDAPVRRALKAVFPNIKDVSVEIDAGNNVLYCTVPWMKVKAPVALVSSGINKLLLILLGIASLNKGIVLIDEIENSIYYKTYPKVWESILHFCRRFKVQVFASTHSMECLRATLPTLRENEAISAFSGSKGRRTLVSCVSSRAKILRRRWRPRPK